MDESTHEEPDKRVCTCGAGYFCTFECEYCDAFKEPEETECDRRNPHYPQTVEEKHRFMTEAFGIPEETDRKEQE